MSLLDIYILILTVAYGACIGSFLNVVIIRLPEGRDLVFTRSRCAVTGEPLRWYENIPIVSWVIQGGKSRFSGTPISIQYPLVEGFTALMFGALFLAYYYFSLRPEFANLGVMGTWPVFVAHLVLVAGLIAATVIDWKLFIIPIEIPYVAFAMGVAFLVGGAIWTGSVEPVAPVVSPRWVNASVAGSVGLAIALGLLRVGVIPWSFEGVAAYDAAQEAKIKAKIEAELEAKMKKDVERGSAADQKAEAEAIAEKLNEAMELEGPDLWVAYPYVRRMMVKECVFLLLPVAFALGAFVYLPTSVGGDFYPLWLRVLGGCLTGFLGAALLVWGVRIVFTLILNKEAMGLGDVHLLGAIGGILGFDVAVWVFGTAPFFGLSAVVIGLLAGRGFRTKVKAIPYGPYLAIATVVQLFLNPQFDRAFAAWSAVMSGAGVR